MKLYEITFSPTGGTKKVSSFLTSALAGEVISVDLTDSKQDFSAISLCSEDVAVISVPSYGGRVPAVAVERLAKISGNSAQAVLVCVYGNRAYEDTLAELEDTAKQAGFRVVADVAAIAEHSIVHQVAAGRPNEQDARQLSEFAKKISEKLSEKDCWEPLIPGKRPYKKFGGASMIPKPTTDCTKCGVCAQKCPVQAIDLHDPKNVNETACISCMRCVSVCPHAARVIDSDKLSAVAAMLQKVCAEPKENELFL